MPLSKEEKTNRIAKLRERSDYSLPAPGVVLAKGAESPVQPNGAEGHISFPDQVELDIKDILEKKQNEGIIGWGTRCQEIRKQMNHTPQQAADAIGISRKTLQIEESKRDATDVDPFFLEVFSLLYCVSPYQLLGLEAPIIDPLRNVDDSISKYINAIISTLYKEDDPEKIAFLDSCGVNVCPPVFKRSKTIFLSLLTSNLSFSDSFNMIIDERYLLSRPSLIF